MIRTLDQQMPPQQVGWKLARLKTMHDKGIRVPSLFCLTGDFFRRAVSADAVESSLRGLDFTDWPKVLTAAQRIRDAIVAQGLGAEGERLLADTLATTFDEDAMLAVRASVIGDRLADGEDSAEHSFAGMSDSFLYVPVPQVRDAVLRCFASAFNPEGLLYRHRQRLPLDRLRVAVGVQQMVFGERSLVLFTCDPNSYVRNTVISAGWGIGEGVVAEQTATDHYFVHARTGEVSRVIADKTTMVTFDEAAGHGSRSVPVDPDLRRSPVLGDDRLTELVDLGHRIERVFEAPQDIEATITADGTVHVLQSRPITVNADRHRIFSSANVSESFPGTTTPMTYSVARRFYWLLNHDYLRRCGVPERKLHDLHETMTRLLGFLDGRIYHNITSFITMLSVFELFDGVRRDWERLVAELDSFYHHPVDRPVNRRGRLLRFARLAVGWARAARNYATLARDFAGFRSDWAELMRARRAVPMNETHPLELLADYREVWRRVGRMWGVTLINYQFMVLSHKFIERCLAKWNVDDGDVLFSELLCGGKQLEGATIALNAVRLAELVRADTDLESAFASQTPEELWRRLRAGELNERFTAAVDSHLDRYGDRGLEELKLERPNLRAQPWELLRLVGKYAASGVTVADMERTEADTRRAGEDRLRHALPSRRRRTIVLSLFSRLRTFLYYREVGRYMRSELFGYSKQVIAALGTQLHRRRVLDDPEDVFLLDLDELFGFLDGSGYTHDLAGLVEIRRNDLTKAAQRHPQREFASADVVGLSIPETPGAVTRTPTEEGTLTGLGSCPGRVRGRARVVFDPSYAGDLDATDILIARETDPGWLYLMLTVRGIVVERGSLLSHTAITGRKFGIPTIVAVPGATTRIPDGALIELDGVAGTVTVVEP